MANQQTYNRFSIAQRIEHIVLLVSFTTLGLTGIPQKYAGNAIAEWFIRLLGGIETIRIIHHTSAIIFTALAIYHMVVLAYKVFVSHSELSMLPGLRDATDALGLLSYNLGLSKKRPALPRYSFDEKVEYWAMIWGTVIMALTGFMLWNPILITRLLPGEIIPAAKAAHGGEAVLAVLAIIIWHLYNVHIKHFNKSMFTGKMTRHEMENEHAEELARLERGAVRPLPSAQVVRSRQRSFFPVAVPVALLLAGGLYWAATAEKTAITTVPTPNLKVFVPLPTAVVTESAVEIAVAIPHTLTGMDKCDTCHGLNGVKPYPATHEGRSNASCQVCHKPSPTASGTPNVRAASGTPAAAIPHPIVGREDCVMCHKLGGIKPFPADHDGRDNTTCTACHSLAAGITGTPQATNGPSAGGTAPAIAHSIEGDMYKDCLKCHSAGQIKPFPANHASFTVDTCTTCHQPQSAASGATAAAATPTAGSTAGAATATVGSTAGAATSVPGSTAAAPAGGTAPAIAHSIEGDMYKDCLKCHGAGQIKPFPANHASFTVDTCTACHQPQGAPSSGAAGAASGTATSPAPVTAKAPTVSHVTDGDLFKDCLKCHGTGKTWPFPANHASFSVDTCTTCHKPTGS